MIDIESIKDSLIGIIRTAVGSELSLIGPTGNQFPAVIRDRQSGNAPQYPYGVVDFITSSDDGAWLTDTYADDLTNKIEYHTDKLLLFRVTFYGEDGFRIANLLKSRIRFESLRRRLRQECSAAFVSETDVNETPQLRSVEYIDNGFLDLTLSYVDVEIEENSEVIETIEVNAIGSDGGVFDAEGNKIQNINVNVP